MSGKPNDMRHPPATRADVYIMIITPSGKPNDMRHPPATAYERTPPAQRPYGANWTNCPISRPFFADNVSYRPDDASVCGGRLPRMKGLTPAVIARRMGVRSGLAGVRLGSLNTSIGLAAERFPRPPQRRTAPPSGPRLFVVGVFEFREVGK